MFKTLRNALKVKDIRSRLLFTFIALIIVRIGSALPVPGVNQEYFKIWIESQMGEGIGFFQNVDFCIEYFSVHYFLDHYAAFDYCNS